MNERRTSTIHRRVSSSLVLGLVLISACCISDLIGFVDAAKLRFCVVESKHTVNRINKLCPKLKANDGSLVECVIGNDRLNCLRRLNTGDAEFAVLEPEDLVLATENTEYDVLVTHELRLFRNDTQRFAMVALVSSVIESSSDLMGKTFCHSGLENSDDSTRIFATYFQNWIISRKCDRDKTLLENEISSLSHFFDRACIPGPWSSDSTYDYRLKLKYRNLCALCDNPAGCYHSDKYHGREGALLCLNENGADAAWVRLEDALQHFKTLQINETGYSYLCPDGTTRPMGQARPCVWISKPWSVIVANRASAERVAGVVSTLDEHKFPWQRDVEQLVESYITIRIPTETLQTPEDFLRRYPGFVSANGRAGCTPSRTIRWCIASNLEARKCRAMKDAALGYGVEPAISCIQQPNGSACFEAVRTGKCDIFVVKPEGEIEARLKGLKPLARAITNKKQDINVVAILVKNDSDYHTLEDLRGARACFTGYRSIGWNAFVDAMANRTSNQLWNCSDLRAVSNFFKDSCVYGLSGLTLDHPVPLNLHSLCERGDDKMNATAAAYACLNSGRADVAFVNLENGLTDKGKSFITPGENLRSICLDSSSPMSDTCYLTWTELGTVLTNENATELRREEIYSTLLEIDILFGASSLGQTPTFSLYGPYDSSHDVIFSERTQHLQREHDSLRLSRSYNDVIERFVDRHKTYGYCSKANRPTGMIAMFLFVTILFASSA